MEEAPRTAGLWTLLEPLGAGGNGTVWRASHPVHGLGAVKVLKPFEDDEAERKREARFVEREIATLQILPVLEIDGAMPLVDSGTLEDGRPWYSMPLGERLVAREDRYEWALEVVSEVSATLRDMHQHGLVHRDVKPDNIVSLSGRAVLTDFGLARSLDDLSLTKTGEGVGSFGYRAPEAHSRPSEPQFAADVYSAGKTLWVLLTGQEQPPDGSLGLDPTDGLERFGIDDSDDLESLLAAATSRDALDRPTMKQFHEQCRDALDRASLPGLLSEETTRPVASPETRAENLFADVAADNRRRQEATAAAVRATNQVQTSIRKDWLGIATAVGWGEGTGSGGARGPSQDGFESDGWQLRGLYNRGGQIDDRHYQLVAYIRVRPFDGTRTLRYGVTVCVRQGALGHQPEDEEVVDDAEFEWLTYGAGLTQITSELQDFLGSPELRFRIAEELNKMRESAVLGRSPDEQHRRSITRSSLGVDDLGLDMLQIVGELAHKHSGGAIATKQLVEAAALRTGIDEEVALDTLEVLEVTGCVDIDKVMSSDRLGRLRRFTMTTVGLISYLKLFVPEASDTERSIYAAFVDGPVQSDLKTIETAVAGSSGLLVALLANRLEEHDVLMLSKALGPSRSYHVKSHSALEAIVRNLELLIQPLTGD